MIRLADLPQAIQTAINDWRLWVTLSMVTALILNETVASIRDGQPIVAALTRMPFYKVPYLILVCGIIAQAGIGAIPFAVGVIMTLYDAVLKRRRGWREEGVAEGKELGREAMRREQIAAVLANDALTSDEKVRVIAILNSESPAPPVQAES